MEKQIPLRLLVYQWVLLHERCMWLSIPCHPWTSCSWVLQHWQCLSSRGNAEKAPMEGGAEGIPRPFTFSKQNHVVETRIYLQPSNTKWVSRRQILCLFYWKCKGWHPWLCHSRICTPAQSSYSPFSSTHSCLAVLPPSIGFGAMTDFWTKQQFLCTVIPTVFSNAPAPPRLWTFHIPLCRNGYFGAGLQLEQKEEAQQNAIFIKAFNELKVQVNCIYHKIELPQ